MKQRSLYLLLALILTSQLLIAQTKETRNEDKREKTNISDLTQKTSFTLEECLEIAERNNPDLAQLKAITESNRAETGIARSKVRPQLRGELGFQHSIDAQSMVKPRKVGDRIPYVDDIFSGDLVLSAPLYTANKLQNRVKHAKLHTQAALQNFERSKRELIFNVANTFYSMLGQKQVIESLHFSQKAMQSHLNQVSQFVLAKKAAKVDLLRTEVRLADIEQKLIREKNILNVQRTILFNLMGISITEPSRCILDGELALSIEDTDWQEQLSQILNQRQDYQSLMAKVDAQKKLLSIARSERQPEVHLRGSYGNRWTGAVADGRSEEVGQIGIVANFPVFDGGRINATVNKEKQKLQQLEEMLRELKLKIQLELKVAKLNIESTQARIKVTQKAIEQAKESLRIEKEKYEKGKGVIVDVLDAQTALLESQTNFYRALADFNTANAQLKLASGETK